MNKIKKLLQYITVPSPIRRITYLKSITPITVLDTPSKKTVEYMAKLLQDFEKMGSLEEMRKKLNIPEKGIDIKLFIGKNFSDIPIINNELVLSAFQNHVNTLSQPLGLSDNFLEQILLLFLFDAFIDVEYFDAFITQPIKFVVGKRNISDAMYDYSHEVSAIIVPFNVSQNKLNEWLRENGKDIDKQMEDNLPNDPYNLRLHDNTEIALEIVELKDKKKLSFIEITDLLSMKYPNDKRITGEEWIKKNYYQYKQIWNSLPIQPKTK